MKINNPINRKKKQKTMTKIVNEDYLAKSTNTKLDLKYSENRK